MHQFTSVLGIITLLGLAVLLSQNRRQISGRIIWVGLGLQFAIAFLFLAFPPVEMLVNWVARGVTHIIAFAREGSRFVFGEPLLDTSGPWGFVFAIHVLPSIVFFSSLMSVLYHLGIMTRVVGALGWLLRRSLGVTGSEALVVAANVFIGQSEAPLCVKPYLSTMTQSQLMALLTGGFASVSGSILVAYITLLGGGNPEAEVMFTRHLLTASVMSAPAAFLMAKILMPEVEAPREETWTASTPDRETENLLDALALGATNGVRLAVNVGAMLVVFVAFLAMINWPLAALSEWGPVASWRSHLGLPPFTLQNLCGILLTPLAATMSIPWEESRAFGSLLGEKVMATELVAYRSLADMLQSGTEGISRRTAQVASYALCGFANFASIGVQLGALRALAPTRQRDVARLALRAMIAGALASWVTACIAALFLPFE